MKDFVPYQEALALKELGFDEPCFGFYTEEYKTLIKNFCKYPINLPTKPFLAPTYSQSFRWFREKHNQHCFIHYHTKPEYTFAVYNDIGMYWTLDEKIAYNTYEEAELACLIKLIEIVKL